MRLFWRTDEFLIRWTVSAAAVNLFSLFQGQRKTRNANMSHLNIHLYNQRVVELDMKLRLHYCSDCIFFFGVLAFISINHQDIITLLLRQLGCYEANSLDHGSNN